MTAVLRPVVTQSRITSGRRRRLTILVETAGVAKNDVRFIENPRTAPQLVSALSPSITPVGPVVIGSVICAYNNSGSKYYSLDRGVTWVTVTDPIPGGVVGACAQGEGLVVQSAGGVRYTTDYQLNGASQIQAALPTNITTSVLGGFSANAFVSVERNNASDPAQEGIWINQGSVQTQLLNIVNTGAQIKQSPGGIVYVSIGTALYRVDGGGLTLMPVTLLSNAFAVSDTEVMSVSSGNMRVSTLDGNRTANYTGGGGVSFESETPVWNGEEFLAYASTGDRIVYWDGVTFGVTSANTGILASPWAICVEYP